MHGPVNVKPSSTLSDYIQTAQIPGYCTVLWLNKFHEYRNTKHILTFVASVSQPSIIPTSGCLFLEPADIKNIKLGGHLEL